MKEEQKKFFLSEKQRDSNKRVGVGGNQEKRKEKKVREETGKKREQTLERTRRVLCLLVVFVYGDRWRLTAGPLQTAS